MNWRYYNHALLPATAPHEDADVAALDNPETWKPEGGGRPLFARWTSHFDCGYETEWWWCILDKPFDISALKSKYRYDINKGLRNFEIKALDTEIYAEQMYNVNIEAFKAYSINVTIQNKDEYLNSIKENNDIIVIGAFLKGSEELAGYTYVRKNDKFVDWPVHKTNPKYEKLGINAALVYGMCEYFKEDLANGKYICDGERNVYHPTNFQAYLEKYFGFRKAYCRLHLRYAPRTYISFIIYIFYSFRKILRYLPFNFVKKINAVLMMEEIVRAQNNKYEN